MRNAAIAVAAAAVFIAGYFLFFRAPDYTNYPPRPGPILLFGDSLAEGVGANRGHDLASALAERIGEPVENFGVSGDTTKDGLKRIDRALVRRPRLAIVVLGGNDYLRRVPQTETFENLSSIIDFFQADGAVVALLGVRGGLLVDGFADEYKKLAREKGAVYVSDILDGLLGDERYMSDNIHPNDLGYALIADRVADAIRPVLK